MFGFNGLIVLFLFCTVALVLAWTEFCADSHVEKSNPVSALQLQRTYRGEEG